MPHNHADQEDVHTTDGADAAPEECKEQHLADLDENAKRFLSMFSTIRGKIEDLARAESDLRRFELSIEQDRKRLQKTLESAKLGLRNARIQMGVELEKLDAPGFSKITDLIKGREAAGV